MFRRFFPGAFLNSIEQKEGETALLTKTLQSSWRSLPESRYGVWLLYVDPMYGSEAAKASLSGLDAEFVLGFKPLVSNSILAGCFDGLGEKRF